MNNGTEDYFGRPHVVVDRTRVRARFFNKNRISVVYSSPCKHGVWLKHVDIE